MEPRLSRAAWRSTSASTCSNNASDVVTNTTTLSGPCSPCASRSAARNSASAVSSASTITSLGPGSRSMATAPTSWRLASTTKRLPGPKIFSTGFTLSVPSARAAIACAPPILTISVAPEAFNAYKRAGFTRPSGPQGVAATISRTPAAWAKPPVMMDVDTRGAFPPGI